MRRWLRPALATALVTTLAATAVAQRYRSSPIDVPIDKAPPYDGRFVFARLKYPTERPGKKIAKLRGGMRFVVQTRSETLDVPDVMKAKNVQKTIAGRRILLKEVKKAGDQYEVQTTVYRTGLSPAEWNAMNYPGAAIRLLDKDGKPLSSRGWGGGGGPDEMSYNWTFARDAWGGGDEKAGEPFRLVWEIPTETRPMDVDFKFQDLPMP